MVGGDGSKNGHRSKLAQWRQSIAAVPTSVLKSGTCRVFRMHLTVQDGVIQDVVSKVEQSMK
jgi:hypothetical protein